MRDQQPVARSSMVPFLGVVALALFALNFFSFLHRHLHHVRQVICQQEMEARVVMFKTDGGDVLIERQVERDVRMAEQAVREAQQMMERGLERDLERAEQEMHRAERELRSTLRAIERDDRSAHDALRHFEVRLHDEACTRPSHNHSERRRPGVTISEDGALEKTVQLRVIR